jgi:hypothetical protein
MRLKKEEIVKKKLIVHVTISFVAAGLQTPCVEYPASRMIQ